jgi:aspartyl-tRNA(Asn)/glutamyl-tRNA(Gln) amidotransferase subunit C
MKLTTDQIEQIATLARLELSEQEKQMYADQLSVVFEYMELLNEVNVDGVEETTQVTGLEDVFREDEVDSADEATRQAILAEFSEKVGDLLKVRGVFNDQ